MSRIAELLTPFQVTLTAQQLEQLAAHFELLVRWNQKTNLTAVRDPEEMVTRHFGESLFAAKHLVSTETHDVFDVGSGAGFPGVPLKILAPHVKLLLIESQNKKATFLREVIRTLRLRDAEVHGGRAEELKRQADLVTLRAVEKFEQAIRTAASLVRPGGRLGLLIGAAQAEQARGLLPDWAWAASVAVPGSATRVVLAASH